MMSREHFYRTDEIVEAMTETTRRNAERRRVASHVVWAVLGAVLIFFALSGCERARQMHTDVKCSFG